MKKLKLFVGGYYDMRVFKGEHFHGKTPFGKDIQTYTLQDILKLSFVEGTVQEYEQSLNNAYKDEDMDEEKDWENTTDDEKVEAILEYTKDNDIAGLLYFGTEIEADNYKSTILKEINKCEKESTYVGKEQDKQGRFRDIFELTNAI